MLARGNYEFSHTKLEGGNTRRGSCFAKPENAASQIFSRVWGGDHGGADADGAFIIYNLGMGGNLV